MRRPVRRAARCRPPLRSAPGPAPAGGAPPGAGVPGGRGGGRGPSRGGGGDRRRRRNVRQAEPLDPALVGGGPRPDAVAIRNELGARLQTALGELSERRRMAVVLFDVEGYSHAEIAGILGIPEGTVRSEVFHARRRLRVLLADWKEQE